MPISSTTAVRCAHRAHDPNHLARGLRTNRFLRQRRRLCRHTGNRVVRQHRPAVSLYRQLSYRIGGWFRAGGWLHPRWTLELGIDASSTTRVKTTDEVIIQIFPPPTGQFDLEATTKFTSATVAVGYHPPPMKKMRLGYLAGFGFIHARHTDEYLDSPSLTIGSDFSFGLTGSIGGIPTTPILRFTEATRVTTQNIGAFALGFEAAFDVADHVAVVSELRASTFSSAGGAGTFLIRPGVGVRWSF